MNEKTRMPWCTTRGCLLDSSGWNWEIWLNNIRSPNRSSFPFSFEGDPGSLASQTFDNNKKRWSISFIQHWTEWLEDFSEHMWYLRVHPQKQNKRNLLFSHILLFIHSHWHSADNLLVSSLWFEPEEDGAVSLTCVELAHSWWVCGCMGTSVCSECVDLSASAVLLMWQPKRGRFTGHVWLWVSKYKERWKTTCVTLIFSHFWSCFFYFSSLASLWPSEPQWEFPEVPYSSTRQWACYRLATDCSCCHGTLRSPGHPVYAASL